MCQREETKSKDVSLRPWRRFFGHKKGLIFAGILRLSSNDPIDIKNVAQLGKRRARSKREWFLEEMEAEKCQRHFRGAIANHFAIAGEVE